MKKILTVNKFLYPNGGSETYIFKMGEELKKKAYELLEIPFVFAGKGSLEEQVNQVKNMENRGFLSGKELEELIQKARFSIYPSEW